MVGITDPTKEYFKDGLWGWDLTQWRKLALLWGYTDGWAEAVQDAASGEGNAVASTTAVGEGYVHVVQAISAYHNAAAAKSLTIAVIVGGLSVTLIQDASAAASVWVTWSGEVVLKEDDYIRATVIAPGDTKIVYLRACGYKMAIEE